MAATIAVLGDLGPFRAELEQHREIELLWASDAANLAHHLGSDLVDACVIGTGSLTEGEIPLPQDLPVILLVPSAEQAALVPPGPRGRKVQALEGLDSLVRLLEEHTGIKMAKEPRIDLRVAAAVSIDGARYLRETTDLSRSGVGIGRFPEATLGSSVELVIDLPNGPLWLEAEVIRRFNRLGEPITGLAFQNVDPEAEAAIQAVVEGRLGLESGAEPPVLAPLAQADDLEQLRAILTNSGTIEAPRWMLDLANELTPLEISAARGGDAPEWAERGLPLWLTAARCRSEQRGLSRTKTADV